jgi:O-antigen/teichoic acid export membrane protein
LSLPTGPSSGHDPAADAAHAARSGGVQLLAVLGQALMPMCQILLARIFDLGTFGAFQASIAVIEVLSRAGLVGAIGAQHRFIAAHRAAGEDRLALLALGTGTRVAVLVSGLLAVGLAVCAPGFARLWHEPGLRDTVPIMAPGVVFTALTLNLVAATLGAKVARMNLYVRGLAEPGLLLLASVAAWRLGGGAHRMAVAYVLASGATAAIALTACARVFGWANLWRGLTGPRHPEFLRFSLPLGASDVMNAVLQRADTLIITSFAGVDAVAVYAAAEYVTRIIANPRYMFDPIVAPVLSESLAAGARVRARYNLALLTRWVLMASAPIAATVIALRTEILGLFGPAFAGGASTLVILAVSHFVSASLGLTPYVIAMSGRSRLMLLNTFGAAALNVVLGVILVPRMGIAGAACAVLVSVAAFQIGLIVQAWALERVHPFAWPLMAPMVAGAAALVPQLGARHLPLPAGARVPVVIVVGLVVYGGTLARLGLGPEERRFFQKLLPRLLGRVRQRDD